ncbi:PorP/SprF family type IX secretion system membrane protein [Aquirufa lenticrescens]|uniref:PorP/SprF family type IX secretion system membrane protein n=1 Tax=Aquirufa lenticrescens TaxID=2696560 RepID=UPI001CAA6E29|nr:PorP/SprF family type IX secretion system membrane protein [Aquirufa lenticrescens]UAJ14402.1 type IX secretion system membrane protein PorP/SprF [Aquirufa lenticrescens]
MWTRLSIFFYFILSLNAFSLSAQDPQLSQNLANPLLNSPAFAGLQDQNKVYLTHRNQWPNQSANYQYSAAALELSLGKINSGLGLLFSSDKQFSSLQTNSLSLQYAYHANLNETTLLSMGIQGSGVFRSLDYSHLTYGDQLGSFLVNGTLGNTFDPLATQFVSRTSYLDLSAGILINDVDYWLGASVHHLNQPNQSLIRSSDDLITPKYALMGGFSTSLTEHSSLKPAVYVKNQGTFSQLDLGTYLQLDPIVLGVWYRGLPLNKQTAKSASSRESIIGLIGIQNNRYSFGYSYDFTVSGLGAGSGGAHELSFSYVLYWDFGQRKSYQRYRQSFACPKF